MSVGIFSTLPTAIATMTTTPTCILPSHYTTETLIYCDIILFYIKRISKENTLWCPAFCDGHWGLGTVPPNFKVALITCSAQTNRSIFAYFLLAPQPLLLSSWHGILALSKFRKYPSFPPTLTSPPSPAPCCTVNSISSHVAKIDLDDPQSLKV